MTKNWRPNSSDNMKAKTFPAVFLLMAVFVIVGVAAMAGHEMWRDEVQAWLQARDHTSLSGVIQDTRYEKHPLAWGLDRGGDRIFSTTLGTPQDFTQQSFFRLIWNAMFWTMGMT